MSVTKAPARIDAPPGEGAYLTDGVRLAQMCGIDSEGNFMLDDCSVDTTAQRELISVEPKTFLAEWLTVEAFEAKKRAQRAGED